MYPFGASARLGLVPLRAAETLPQPAGPPTAPRRLSVDPRGQVRCAETELQTCAALTDDNRISGELQTQLMAALWRLGAGTVEQVRSEIPPRYRGAYTTVQTVLNRLAERGLLSRRKVGNAIEYRPKIAEADYLSRSIASTLSGASVDARQVALARLIAELDESELTDLKRLGRDVPPRRRKR